jgi:O-antigen ligase
MGSQKIEPLLSFIILASTYLILLTPIIVGYRFFYGYISPKTFYIIALSEIIFSSWLILAIINKKYRPKINLTTLFLGLFVFILVLSSIFGIDPTRSFWSNLERCTGTILIIHLFCFILATSSFFKKKDWHEILFISTIIGLLVAFLLLYSLLGLIDFYGARNGVTLGNSSFLATYLLFVFFFAIYLFFESNSSHLQFLTFEKKEIKFLLGLSIIIVGLALFFSGGRAATLSAFGGLILLYLFYLSFQERRKYLIVLGKIFLIFVLIFILYLVIFLHIPESFPQEMLFKLTSKARPVVWEATWKLIKERPILGFGPENFEIGFVKYFNPCLFLPECGGEVRFDKAHNIIFDTLFSSGFLGLTTYILIFISAFYSLWRRFFRNKINFWTSAVFSSLLISYFMQNLTVFDTPTSYLMFFLVLSFLASFNEKKESQNLPKIKPTKIVLTIAVLILFGFSFNYFAIRPAETAFFATKLSIQSASPEERMSFYKKAISKSLVGKYQLREYYAGNVDKWISKNTTSSQEIEFILNELEKTLKESPYDFYSRIVLARLYNHQGVNDKDKLARAEEILNEAIKLSPANLYSYWYLAETKILQGEYQEALSLAQKAIEIEPRIPSSHLLALKIAKLIGNKDLIEKKVEEITILFPNFATEVKSILEKPTLDLKINSY